MKSRLFLLTLILSLFINPAGYSRTDDVMNDPREIIIKPKAKNSLFLFMVKYNSDDFKALVHQAFVNGTADPDFKKMGINEKNIGFNLGTWEWMASTRDPYLPYTYYNESMIITIRNLESKQKFQVLIFPWMRRAFIPGVTIGKYKFEKVMLTVSLGGANIYNSELDLNNLLPEFTINSNTAYIYGVIDFKHGDIKLVQDEKRMNKLRKYVALVKKFKKNRNMKVVELNADEYYSKLKSESEKGSETAKADSPNAKLTILNMLKEGKITPEQAEKLLNALKQ